MKIRKVVTVDLQGDERFMLRASSAHNYDRRVTGLDYNIGSDSVLAFCVRVYKDGSTARNGRPETISLAQVPAEIAQILAETTAALTREEK